MEQSTLKKFRATSLKWGITIGIVALIYTILLYIINAKLLANLLYTSLSLVIMIILMVLCVKEIKKGQEGYISLSEALFGAFFPFVIGTFISSIFTFILMKYIDPNLPILIKDTVTENTIQMMKNWNVPEEEITKALDKINEKDFTPKIGETLVNFLGVSAFGFVISFIIAAIMKKKKPIFQE